MIGLAAALAIVALGGWVFDAPTLAGAQFGTPMLPGAILLSLLCAYALYQAGVETEQGRSAFSRRVRIPAWIAVVLGVVGVGRHLLGYGDTIDGADELLGAGWLHVSSAAAVGNGVIAAALLLPERLKASNVYPTLLVAPIPALLTALVGYGLDAPALLSTPMFSQLALFATFCIGLLIPAALFLRPTSGWMEFVTRSSASGQTARWFLIVAFTLPLAISAIVQGGRALDLIAYPFGYGVAIVLTVVSISIIGILVAMRLRRAESTAMASQNLLNAIVENTPALIYAKDREGRYLRVNRHLAEMMGRSSEELLGRTDADLFPAELADAYRAVDARVMASGEPIVEEEYAEFQGGNHHYLSSKAPLLDEHGAASGIVGISTDVTELKSVSARLQNKVQRLKLLGEITRAISQRQDIASIFQAAVVAVEDLFNADVSVIALIPPKSDRVEVAHMGPATHRNREKLGLSIGRLIRAEGNPVAECIAQRTLIHVDGRTQNVRPETPAFVKQMGSICLVPILVDDVPYGVMIAGRGDSAAMTSTECEFFKQLVDHIGLSVQQSIMLEALQRTVEDLKMSQASAVARERLAAIGQMASGIAHDLNNGLTPISIHTQALRESGRDLPPEIQSYLRMVDRVIGDMSATIARMRDFYRPENAELERSSVDLRELTSDVIELTRARWSDMAMQQGIVIGVEAEFDADLPHALIDAASIRDALTNLVLNAVDAMPDGGMIFVRGRRQTADDPAADDRILLEVTDSGHGMDAETRERCLDPFFTTKGNRGTGLGLAMVVGAARRHGAELEIDSAPGRGTTMRMSLPVADPVVAAHPRAGVLSTNYGTPAIRILIVDDDPAVLESTANYLKIIGFDVTAAEGGRRGVDAASQAVAAGQAFDVLITDLGMPHIDGDRVASAVKEMAPGTFVIMLTGWGNHMPKGKSKPVNVDALMAKPPDIAELRRLLESVTPQRAH
ncbi:PAS domain-containing protein [Sphingomonas plantiphila]|uniref:PAS domain-containing protein n=1 Tax=Sphingomonas plantiphila TaxID=3163295 RepID=UPI0038B468F3